jgi:opacity protein-like surface antigen
MTRFDGRIRSLLMIAVAAAVLGLGLAAGWEAVRAQGHTHMHGQPAPAAGGWYKRLGPDARAAAIERQLRGFETTMAEVAYRYTEMYFGGVDGNWGYAEHMAHELGNAIDLGLERRPQYRKSAETIFLKGPYPQVMEAIKAKDVALFKQRIETLRAACTACHAAEAHPFIKIGVPTVRRNPVVND